MANMVLACGEAVNILAADTKIIDGKIYGQMLLQLPDSESSEKKMLAYLDEEHVTYTEGE